MPKTRQIASSRSDDSAYVKFLVSLHLVGLGLKSSTAEVNRQTLWEITAGERKPVRRMAESYRQTEIGKDYLEAEGRYEVTIAEGDRVGLKIECIFEVHMHAPSPVDPVMVERFAKQDLRFVLLPYARNFVSDMSGRMQIPPVILPLITAAGKARPRKGKEG